MSSISAVSIIEALVGKKNEEIRVKFSSDIKVQCCYENIACCFKERQIASLKNRRLIYHPDNSENTRGVLLPEKRRNIFKSICCCGSGKERNSELGQKVMEYLESAYGKVPAKIAVGEFCQKRGLKWDNLQNWIKPLTIADMIILNDRAKGMQEIVRHSIFYQRAIECMQQAHSPRIIQVETSPDSHSSFYGYPQNECSPSFFDLASPSQAPGLQEGQMSTFQLTPTHSPNRDRFELPNVSICVTEELQEAFSQCEQQGDPSFESCLMLYRAVIKQK